MWGSFAVIAASTGCGRGRAMCGRLGSPEWMFSGTENMDKLAGPSKPGPDAERVKVDKPWGDAVKEALKKKRPKDGWPKPPEKEGVKPEKG